MQDYFGSTYEAEIFSKRYQDPGRRDYESSWEDVFKRVAEAVAGGSDLALAIEQASPGLQERFRRLMFTGAAMPSSPQLWNYGSTRRSKRQGSSCFTVALGDNLRSFRQADDYAERIYVSSGGAGVLANAARPRGCKISYANSRAVGVLGSGGPIRRLEATTGYITNGGRERGALMVQLSAWHPDVIEFILCKKPKALGFLDDWMTHARAALHAGDQKNILIRWLIERYGSRWSLRKEWPGRILVIHDIVDNGGATQDDALVAITRLEALGLLAEDSLGRLVPRVFDYGIGESGAWREANRDWDLPLQNCNMSVRIPDALMRAAERDDDWVLAWDSATSAVGLGADEEYAKEGENPWLSTDIDGELEEWYDGRDLAVHYGRDAITVERLGGNKIRHRPARYAVVLTTWAGVRANTAPNVNNFKDVEYARFYREVMLKEIERYGDGKIKARQILDLIFRAARGWADPGVVFEDTYEKFNPTDIQVYGPRLSNPCSEFVNPPNGSCDLVSINLRYIADMITAPARHVLTTESQWILLRKSDEFRTMIRELHSVAVRTYEYIQCAHQHNVAPVEDINEYSRNHYRTVGVGVMGLAEALIAFRVRYGSEAARCMAAAMQAEVYITCWEESFRFARELNEPKPLAWNPARMRAIFRERIRYVELYKLDASVAVRLERLLARIENGEYATNTAVTSIAPTGTISMIASWVLSRAASNGVYRYKHVSGSAEPVFSARQGRRDNSGSTELIHDMWLPGSAPWLVTASEISAAEHARMQAAVCAFCCMSASKTINLPEAATVDDVAAGYTEAWRLEIPGTSIYRNNSKPVQVLTALDCPSGDCSVEYEESDPSLEPIL